MSILSNFISEYGNTIIYAVLTAIAGFLASQVRVVYKKLAEDKTKKAVVETCVKAVEQLYQDLEGPEKFAKACENISSILSEKGIYISELEMHLLIEACVAEFNFNFTKEEE
ncbi:MAG: hypothetical protein E7571_00850 [Ruminococcaceae bacterium]|nr:hypothetical protein [Oscillospiraceae bacterium]